MNEKRKNLKVTKETETGRNLEFVNLNSGIHFTLEHAIEQIEKGNPSYKGYQVVEPKEKPAYIRSNPDNSKRNNLE